MNKIVFYKVLERYYLSILSIRFCSRWPGYTRGSGGLSILSIRFLSRILEYWSGPEEPPFNSID